MLSHLSVSANDIFVGAQLLQPHGAPGVELLGGNAHLTAQPNSPPSVNRVEQLRYTRRAVYAPAEALGGGGVSGDDGLAVAGWSGGAMWAMASSRESTTLTARI